jgi:hypothetical protein
MSSPGEEVSCHAAVIRGAEGTIGERNVDGCQEPRKDGGKR